MSYGGMAVYWQYLSSIQCSVAKDILWDTVYIFKTQLSVLFVFSIPLLKIIYY